MFWTFSIQVFGHVDWPFGLLFRGSKCKVRNALLGFRGSGALQQIWGFAILVPFRIEERAQRLTFWLPGGPREGVLAEKFAPALESLSSLGFQERNLRCSGNLAGMSRNSGVFQKFVPKMFVRIFRSLGVFSPGY